MQCTPFPTAGHHLDASPLAPGVAAAACLKEICSVLRRILIAVGFVTLTLVEVFGSLSAISAAEYEKRVPNWLLTYECQAASYDQNRHEDRVI